MSSTKLYRFAVRSGPVVAGLSRSREVIIIATSLEKALAILKRNREELASRRYTVEEHCLLPNL